MNCGKLLGDHVEDGLAKVGVTKERVTNWLGRPCGCAELQERLNQLDSWLRMIARNKLAQVKAYVEAVLDEAG